MYQVEVHLKPCFLDYSMISNADSVQKSCSAGHFTKGVNPILLV